MPINNYIFISIFNDELHLYNRNGYNIKEIIENNSKNDLGYKEIIGCFGAKSSEVFYDPTTKNLIKQNNYHRATGLSGRNLEDFIKSTIPLWKETYYNPITGKQIYSKEYNDSGITPINEKFFDYDSGKRIVLSYYGFNRPAEHVAIYPNLITLNKEKEAWFNMDGKTIKHILGLRECTKSQWETRQMANSIHNIIKSLDNTESFEQILGPTCITQGICNEGKECCY